MVLRVGRKEGRDLDRLLYVVAQKPLRNVIAYIMSEIDYSLDIIANEIRVFPREPQFVDVTTLNSRISNWRLTRGHKQYSHPVAKF